MSLEQDKLNDSEKKKVERNLQSAAKDVVHAERNTKRAQKIIDEAHDELVRAKIRSEIKTKKKHIDGASQKISVAQSLLSDSRTQLSEASQKTSVSGNVVGDRLASIPQYQYFASGLAPNASNLVRHKRVGGMYESHSEARSSMRSMNITYGKKSGQGRTHKIRNGKFAGNYLIYVRDDE